MKKVTGALRESSTARGVLLAPVLLACSLLASCDAQQADASPVVTVRSFDPGPLERLVPLDPKQILEGNPITHAIDVYESADHQVVVSYWSSTAGRFTWNYAGINEVITVLEGEAFVKMSDGQTLHLKPGATVSFANADVAEWHVPIYIRKVAVVNYPPRTFVDRVLGRVQKIMS